MAVRYIIAGIFPRTMSITRSLPPPVGPNMGVVCSAPGGLGVHVA